MTWTQVLNIAGVILAASLTHALSRRISARVLARVRGALPPDPWILYFLIFTVILLTGFHALGAMALVTGVNLVHITTLTGLLFTAWFAARLLFPEIPEAPPARPRDPFFQRVAQASWAILPCGHIERWGVGVATALYLLFTLEAVTRPPTGWDGMVYHLPLAAKWLQNGNLNFLTESWKFQTPANGDLVLLFLMYLGEDRILSLAFLPFALAGVVLVYSFARRLDVSHDHAIIAAGGFGTMPIILFHAFSAYVDLLGAVFVLCAVYLILWWIQEKDAIQAGGRLQLALAGLAFGVALGSKYTFVPLTAVLAAAGLSGLMGGGRLSVSRHQITEAVRPGLTIFAWSLVPSAYWYVRNFLAMGNPLHPIQFTIDGFMPRVSLRAMDEVRSWAARLLCEGSPCNALGNWITRPWTEFHFAGEFFSVNSGLGPVFASFIPLAVLTAVPLVLARLLRERRLPLVAFPLLISAVLLSYWWFYVYRLLRLTLAALGIMFPLVGYGIGLLSGPRQRLARGLFLCAVATNAFLLAASPLASLGSRISHKTWSRSAHYGVPEVLDFLPRDSVVLNAGHELKNYPLFGRNLRNRVVTNRALLEPERATRITAAFIKKWRIDYLYYATNRKLILEDEDKYQVVHRQAMQGAFGQYVEVLYRTDRSLGGPGRARQTVDRDGRSAPGEGG